MESTLSLLPGSIVEHFDTGGTESLASEAAAVGECTANEK
jgi:hypothetical protein